ncbi:MAG: N-acetylmuramoyl-L-alanine amidase, partial [Bradymonadaceae bacterium]|nr:N-acetylmuramoyl-L-alanine amidase [Lujinxingiaceae bacterium]
LMRRGGLFLLLAFVTAAFASCGFDDQEGFLEIDDDLEIRVQELTGFCTVQIKGHGAVDVESDYLPNSIACENGNAPLEALKAQAIAARTYAKFITEAEKRPLEPTTRDQVYKCSYATPKPIHYQAVRETAGQVLTHEGKLIVGFYVAGSLRSGASCAAGNDPTGTERRVTYNQGLTGNQVKKTSLGSMSHPANRGAKSQNGAACWASNGWKVERILRYYYGDDMRLAELPGQCAGGEPGGEPGGGGGEDDICRPGVASDTTVPTCTGSDSVPQILPRSAWNARPPKRNQSAHTPNRISIHHTVTSNTSTDSAAMVRQVQGWHFDRNFPDIGYHFLVAADGKIYRGADESRMGTHVKNQNSHNLGIALLGTFHQSTAPSDAQLKSVARLLAYLGKKYNIELNRTNVKGHGERMATQCPGGQVLKRLDDMLAWAKADTICTGADADKPQQDDAPGAGSDKDTKGYRYVRIKTTSTQPVGHNDPIDGFEVDAVYIERSGTSGSELIYASAVVCSPGVSNPGGALGAPDNFTCADRAQTVAGVPVGAQLMLEMPSAIKPGDILFVTKHAYQPALNDCEPSHTARVSISEDGRVWKSLDQTVSGNWRLPLQDAHFEADPEDETSSEDDAFDFVTPRAGHWYTPKLTLKVRSSNPAVVKVVYHAEEFDLGSSQNRDSLFSVDREFNRFGVRRIIARGYDVDGKEIAKKEISITVTGFDGTIPGGQTEPGSPG